MGKFKELAIEQMHRHLLKFELQHRCGKPYYYPLNQLAVDLLRFMKQKSLSQQDFTRLTALRIFDIETEVQNENT